MLVVEFVVYLSHDEDVDEIFPQGVEVERIHPL